MDSGLEKLRLRPNDETTFLYKSKEAFERGACRAQRWIGDAEFPPEMNRYHIFVNYGCGWCHQLLIVREMLGLKDSISVTHVGARRGAGERGTPSYEGYVIPGNADEKREAFPEYGSGLDFRCMRDVYNQPADLGWGELGWDPEAEGKDKPYGTSQLTIPVLFDKVTRRVVSNDPAQMLLMLNHWRKELGARSSLAEGEGLYPEDLQGEIEAINSVVFPGLNNGVYCCWFSDPDGGEEGAFQEGFALVQSTFQYLEDYLAKTEAGPYLLGQNPTLADARAFPHLYRFDTIYHELMLRNKGYRIFEPEGQFPNLARYISVTMSPLVKNACDLQVANRFYFSSTPEGEADRKYDMNRARGQAWLPTREEWEKKRAADGFRDEQMHTVALQWSGL